jgi:hypothetical protein
VRGKKNTIFGKPHCHSGGILFVAGDYPKFKKDSLACLEPLAGQASRMTFLLQSFSM